MLKHKHHFPENIVPEPFLCLFICAKITKMLRQCIIRSADERGALIRTHFCDVY